MERGGVVLGGQRRDNEEGGGVREIEREGEIERGRQRQRERARVCVKGLHVIKQKLTGLSFILA